MVVGPKKRSVRDEDADNDGDDDDDDDDRPRKSKSKSKSKKRAREDSDEDEDGVDDDEDELDLSDVESGSDNEFVNSKIQPRRKREKQPEREDGPAKKSKKLDGLEERRLQFFEKQKETEQKPKSPKPARGSEDENDDEEEEEEQTAVKKKKKTKAAAAESVPPPVQLRESKRKVLSDDEEAEEEENRKKKLAEKKPDPEKDSRTVFVGNLPTTVLEKASSLFSTNHFSAKFSILHNVYPGPQKASKELKRRFAQYGAIESVRFRSIAVAAPNVPRKFAVAQRKLHPERDNLNGQRPFFPLHLRE